MRMNISVPDALAEQVRTYDLPISAICQKALNTAVRNVERRAALGGDLDEVAERLRGTVDDATKAKRAHGRHDGIAYAKYYATADDLKQLEGGIYDLTSPSLIDFMSATLGRLVPSVDIDNTDPYWAGFLAGTTEVWEAVRSLV
jgi:post-segregation antitoxin (ccd killing protein)